MFWVFTTKLGCDTVNGLAKAFLPQDKYSDGAVATPQITNKWCDPIQLTDTRWVMPFLSGLNPIAVTEIAYEVISPLLPSVKSPV